MKIKYEFVTGEIVEIDVPEHIAEVAIENDKDIKNSNRRETDKHSSFEVLEDKGIQLPDKSVDIHNLIEQQETRQALHKAMDSLLPQQRELIQKVFFEGQTMVDIAQKEGVCESAIRDRFSRIYKKLKKIMIAN